MLPWSVLLMNREIVCSTWAYILIEFYCVSNWLLILVLIELEFGCFFNCVCVFLCFSPFLIKIHFDCFLIVSVFVCVSLLPAWLGTFLLARVNTICVIIVFVFCFNRFFALIVFFLYCVCVLFCLSLLLAWQGTILRAHVYLLVGVSESFAFKNQAGNS